MNYHIQNVIINDRQLLDETREEEFMKKYMKTNPDDHCYLIMAKIVDNMVIIYAYNAKEQPLTTLELPRDQFDEFRERFVESEWYELGRTESSVGKLQTIYFAPQGRKFLNMDNWKKKQRMENGIRILGSIK